MKNGVTEYSNQVKGNQCNFDAPVRFDVVDGYVGITQYDPSGKLVNDRVLLTPAQFKALCRFVDSRS